MKTSDVMTRSVVTIQPNAGLLDAIRLMLGQRISGLPVVDANGVLVGMLTEGDLLRGPRRARRGSGRNGWNFSADRGGRPRTLFVPMAVGWRT